jgi:type I restriction-modification system DNA methylase subunit
MIRFQDERDVDRYVEEKLKSIGFVLKKDFNDQRNMSGYLKDSLKGSSKTENKTGMGVPDFTVEKYKEIAPVIIENKVGLKKLQKSTKDGISRNDRDVQNFAVNGAVSYARHMIHSGKYDSVIAIGIAGDTDKDLAIVVYYVFGFEGEPKLMSNYTTFDFLENQDTFKNFIADATLTEEEKHSILMKSQEELHSHANKLNKLMYAHSIGVAERVIYVSGMLLSMQDIVGNDGEIILEGLSPQKLKGVQTDRNRDGVKVLTQIDEYLTNKAVPDNKKRLMLASFDRISVDVDRDKPIELSPLVSKSIKGNASITRQVFQYVYDNVFTKIAGTAGHLDIIGEMYSIFLKYALGDGKEIGIVLTPPYVTKLMAQILGINKDSRVLDVATGSAGFLISCMEIMIEQTNEKYGKGTTRANKKIEKIKNSQLMGVERDSQMYTLAATNMIMRGDGSAKIEKGSSFDQPKQLYETFNATALILNPPFSYAENGMPFLAFGLKHMKKGGKAAIIIQDSAGSGVAVKSNQEILRNNRLLASIKMPTDLFLPYAGVQTSIYIFEVGVKHNFKTDIVKFIDFRHDGYKRTQRTIYEIDKPQERYSDIPIIYNMGFNADKNDGFHVDLWDLPNVYVEDTITDCGADWNFEQHKKIEIKPQAADFEKTVGDYLAWEVKKLIKIGFSEKEATDCLKK